MKQQSASQKLAKISEKTKREVNSVQTCQRGTKGIQGHRTWKAPRGRSKPPKAPEKEMVKTRPGGGGASIRPARSVRIETQKTHGNATSRIEKIYPVNPASTTY